MVIIVLTSRLNSTRLFRVELDLQLSGTEWTSLLAGGGLRRVGMQPGMEGKGGVQVGK